MIKKILLWFLNSWLLKLILGPKLAGAAAGAEQGYEKGAAEEQAEAVETQAAEIQQIHAKVEAKKEEAHAEVASAADPDAAVNEQLRELGIITDGPETGPGHGGPDAPAPAPGKTQGG